MGARTVEIAAVPSLGLLAGGGAITGFLNTVDPVFLVIAVVVLPLAAAHVRYVASQPARP